MKPQLKYWRSLSKQQKAELKARHQIKIVTFHWIESVYKYVSVGRK